MNILVPLSGFLCFFAWWMMRYCIMPSYRHYQIKKRLTPNENNILKALNKFYFFTRGNLISQEGKPGKRNPTNALYGEIDFWGFTDFLKKIPLSQEEIFYDLGAGTGKAVFLMAYLFQIKKASGIECDPALFAASARLLKSMDKIPYPNLSALAFICDDFLKTDFLEATLIFVNATAFDDTLWLNLHNIFNQLAPKTRIITSSRPLLGDSFRYLSSDNVLMSFGMTTLYVYEKL